jgi:protein-L-isoaspartate(D-aspartate) O-methyltransferase
MADSLEGYAQRRLNMVDGQLRTFEVTDQAVIAAFNEEPREMFVEPRLASVAYCDGEVPALGGSGRMLLPPMILARLIQALTVRPGEKILDVAGGSGYGAAILARLGASVVALDSDAGAVAAAKAMFGGRPDITHVVGPLGDGVAAKAPFAAILVHGAFQTMPEKLLAQLGDGGRLVGIDASEGAGRAVLVERINGASSRRVLFGASAPALEAFRAPAEFAF